MAKLRIGLLALAGLSWLAPLAAADPTPMVKPPVGWHADAERAAAAIAAAGPNTAIEIYAPETPGAVLIATRTGAVDVQAAIDSLHGTVARAKLTSATVVEDAWSSSPNGAELRWHDADTIEVARLVSAGRIVVTGECIAATEAALAGCTGALATLDPGTPGPTIAPAPPPSTDKPSHPARMEDGSRIQLPPITVPAPDTSTDKRPMYIGAGILALTAVFWWNRRRRERFHRDDDDANDLHDAARPKGPDDER